MSDPKNQQKSGAFQNLFKNTPQQLPTPPRPLDATMNPPQPSESHAPTSQETGGLERTTMTDREIRTSEKSDAGNVEGISGMPREHRTREDGALRQAQGDTVQVSKEKQIETFKKKAARKLAKKVPLKKKEKKPARAKKAMKKVGKKSTAKRKKKIAKRPAKKSPRMKVGKKSAKRAMKKPAKGKRRSKGKRR